MSEMSRALRLLGAKLPLSLIQFPSGKWGFVGSVPAALYYDSEVSADALRELTETSFPALVMKKHGIKHRVFETEQAALDTAARLGHTIQS